MGGHVGRRVYLPPGMKNLKCESSTPRHHRSISKYHRSHTFLKVVRIMVGLIAVSHWCFETPENSADLNHTPPLWRWVEGTTAVVIDNSKLLFLTGPPGTP